MRGNNLEYRSRSSTSELHLSTCVHFAQLARPGLRSLTHLPLGLSNLTSSPSSLSCCVHFCVRCREVDRMVQMQLQCLLFDLLPALRHIGVDIVHWEDIRPAAQAEVGRDKGKGTADKGAVDEWW